MIVYPLQKHFVSNTIKQVFAGMNLVTYVNTTFIEIIKNRPPSLCQFFKTGLYQTSRSLRPWMKSMPKKRTTKSGMCIQAQVLRSFSCISELLYGPFSPGLWIFFVRVRSECIEQIIIGRVHCHKLSL